MKTIWQYLIFVFCVILFKVCTLKEVLPSRLSVQLQQLANFPVRLEKES